MAVSVGPVVRLWQVLLDTVAATVVERGCGRRETSLVAV